MDPHIFFPDQPGLDPPGVGPGDGGGVLARPVAAAGCIVLVACTVLWRGRSPGPRWFLLCLGLTLVVNDALIGDVLKHLIHRPRPFQAMPGVRQVDLDHRAHPRFFALLHPLDRTDFDR